jgi:hypothetical protein
MATTGFVLSGTQANYNDGGNRAWSNPTNAATDNGSNATSSLNIGTYIRSQRLRLSNFNFSSIPDGATITQINVRYNLFRASTIGAQVDNIYLLVGGVEAGSPLGSGTVLSSTTSSLVNVSFISGLPTVAQVKNSGFGSSLKVVCTSGSTAANVSCDVGWIEVVYDPPNIGLTVESTLSAFSQAAQARQSMDLSTTSSLQPFTQQASASSTAGLTATSILGAFTQAASLNAIVPPPPLRDVVDKEEYEDVLLVLLTIDHPNLSEPIRVCDDIADVTSNGHLFVGCPFQIALPGSSPGQIPKATITLDNVDRRIVQGVRSITSPPSVTIQVINRTYPDVVEVEFADMTMYVATYDPMKVSGDATFENYLSAAFPAASFDPANFPGIF